MACVCTVFSGSPAVQKAADDTEKLSSTSEGRMALHKIATYVLKFFQEYLPQLFNASCESAMKMISLADSLFVGTIMFSLLGYFGHSKEAKPHLEEKNGEVVKNLDKTPYQGEALTQFQKDAKDKPFVALGNVSYFWASFTCAIKILENCSLKVLSTVSNALGSMGGIGKAIGKGVCKWFYISGDFCVALASLSLVAHRLNRIFFQPRGKDFDYNTEVKLLMARTAIFALDVLNLAGHAVPFLAPIGIVAGCSEAWAFLKTNEMSDAESKTPEAQEQARLYQKAKVQVGG